MSKTIVRISLSEREMKTVSLLLEEFNIGDMPDLFRFLLSRTLEELKIKNLKYGAKAPSVSKVLKEMREDAFRALKAMDPEEMTAELGRIGAIELSGVQPNTIAFKQYVGTHPESGTKVLWYETKEGRFEATPDLDTLLQNIKKDLVHFYPKSLLQ